MDNKNDNKKLYVVIGVLAAAVFILAAVLVVVVFNKKTPESPVDKTVNTTVDTVKEDKPATEKQDLFENEVVDDYASLDNKEKTFVVDGYEFVCPAEYNLSYADGVGVYVTVSDVFQMKLGVRDRTFAEYVEMGNEVTQKSIDAGGTVLQDVKSTSLNGRDILYFMVELLGDKTMVAYTAIPGEKSVGCQLVIQNENLTDEDVLEIFEKVAATAQVTDKPNSTLDEIIETNVNSSKGEVKEETVLTVGNQSVTVKVPEGFCSDFDSLHDTYFKESFTTENTEIMADIYYYTEKLYFDGAEDYVKDELETLTYMDEKIKKEKVHTKEINGNKVYYLEVTYKSDDKTCQRLVGAIDLPGDQVYAMHATSFREDLKLDIDRVEKFFEVEMN